MAVQFNKMNTKTELLAPHQGRKIVFTEHLNKRIFDVPTDETLAEVCLLVLRERYINPAWGYKPDGLKENMPSQDELEFIHWYNSTDLNSLPKLILRHATRIYTQLSQRTNWASKHEWDWYDTVEQLLLLPKEEATTYRKPYKGRYIPTAYYLLLQREHNPGEQVDLIISST